VFDGNDEETATHFDGILNVAELLNGANTRVGQNMSLKIRQKFKILLHGLSKVVGGAVA
jgi:hypothetical protein